MALSGYQRKALAALLTEPNISAAADKAGLNRNTIYNYLADDDFKAALAKAESEALAHLARNMAAHSQKAIVTLAAILDDPNASRNEKIKAARAILAALPNIRLLGSIEARLTELEQAKNDKP